MSYPLVFDPQHRVSESRASVFKNRRQTYFLHACENNNLNFLKKKLKKSFFHKKIDLNYAEGIQTPLCVAAKKGHVEVIQILLDSGAHINLRNDLGSSAMMEAVISGKKTAVSFLLQRGADFGVSDIQGKNLLHYAAVGSDVDILEILLIQFGNALRVNDRDKEGKTPLYLAIERGKFESIKLLIKYNPNLEINSFQNLKVLDFVLACKNIQHDNKKKVLALLVNYIQDFANNVVFYLRGFVGSGNEDILGLILQNIIFSYASTKMGHEILLKVISKALESQKIAHFSMKNTINLDITENNDAEKTFLKQHNPEPRAKTPTNCDVTIEENKKSGRSRLLK